MVAFGFLALIGYVSLFTIGQNIIARRRGANNQAKAVPFTLLGLLLWAIFATVGILSPTLMKHQHPVPVAIIVGLTLVFIGLGLSMWSQWSLGKHWVGGIGIHKKHQLRVNGPFRIVRHPMYSGMFISTIGLGVASLNIWYTLTVLCFPIAFALRIPGEEKLLRERFTKAYPAYAASTGMLIPKIKSRK